MKPKTNTTLNPLSAHYWAIGAEQAAEGHPVKTPDTTFIEFDFLHSISLLDGEDPDEFPWEELRSAVSEHGTPAFLRTDLISAKKSGVTGVRVDAENDLEATVATTITAAANRHQHPASFMVRDWIDIEQSFTAFSGLSIGTEFRVFASPDEHHCTHYYWPLDSIKDPSIPATEIHEHVATHATTNLPDWLSEAAKDAAYWADHANGVDNPDREWSVDFARDEDGDWWIIDMSPEERSWHPDHDTTISGVDRSE